MFNWFQKRKKVESPVAMDRRLQRLFEEGFTCRSCGKLHKGLFDLGIPRPDHWTEGLDIKPKTKDLLTDHFITDDVCVRNGEDYFVRCVLDLPILGLDDQRFGYGVWSSLSKKNFSYYLEHFSDSPPEDMSPWFGWFANTLKGYPETQSLKCDVHPQPNKRRPLLRLQQADHPLFREQQAGISVDRVFELYKINGHDLI